MFAARAGAKHVFGIDNSAIITNARDIVRQNGENVLRSCL